MALAATVASGVADPARADVYKYRDPQGRILLTDTPVKETGYRLEKRISMPRYQASENTAAVNLSGFEENRNRFAPLIDQVAKQVELHPALLHAVVMAESSYDPNAVSRKGAVGLMQLMPATANRYGVSDPTDPRENLHAGARYLRDLLSSFEENLELALAAYNAGEQAVLRSGGQIPAYPETQRYVKKVLEFYRHLRPQV